MFKLNFWKQGKADFIIPELPPELRGRTGCILKEAIADPAVGTEVVLYLLDQPQYAAELGALRKISLFAKTGVLRTSAGLIAFILWTVHGLKVTSGSKSWQLELAE